jgi:hypothetical protein
MARIDAEAQSFGIALVPGNGNDDNIDSAPCVDLNGMSRGQLSKPDFENATRVPSPCMHSSSLVYGGALTSSQSLRGIVMQR